ncbi:bifunctional DNA-formamidopyrimidine glycosylase/DNA-(apurinic or apyrimidinic site) lyase [Mycoplasmopsis phocirhinis]|uniref:Bifunctional DNA-formamidopyrimidine glycosylase/DNA-(Apurinic or apyrimidinic site) lyase n=1 Tax=Mycoplasmopsis phocirhinis TaxID=142650 RepID=A0A4P6MLZ9_9BACT|nr:bifunctional DNA-formamidopyrimidine glycosylase/DNA-(apurinic or apyrimidinic site) lyase [Mycoplasmopsis phocirhinis]QBF34498.1 bifunctional DNA-formamidopyrimidine glycosylase/DNA-(apurinic or apyrimidinic site) lyase [Mycoplasmopsis phocirhinis]
MPEMPEVNNVVNKLKPLILNSTIIDVEIYKTKLIQDIDSNQFKQTIINKTIKNIFNLGKHIIIELDNDYFILNHLRMTGKYAFYAKYHHPTIHDHVVFKLNNGVLYFNDARAFATFHLKTKNELYTTNPLKNLAKVPFETDINELYLKIQKRSQAIKNILLDQRLILGIGNIYANEALWLSQIHPSTPANKLDKQELKNLIINAGEIMEIATKMGGSSIQSYSALNGEKGRYQNELKVHGRDKLPCYRCQNIIKKYFVSGRGSYYCSFCQGEK